MNILAILRSCENYASTCKTKFFLTSNTFLAFVGPFLNTTQFNKSRSQTMTWHEFSLKFKIHFKNSRFILNYEIELVLPSDDLGLTATVTLTKRKKDWMDKKGKSFFF